MVRDSDPIRGERGERTINGLNAIVKRTEREGSGVTHSVFLVVDSDADDLATFASALTSRYATEYEIRAAATASEAHANPGGTLRRRHYRRPAHRLAGPGGHRPPLAP